MRVLRVLALWAFVAALYLLLEQGWENGLWPMIADFRHMYWDAPAWIGVLESVLGPFIIGCFIAGALRRQLAESPWPIIFAPVIMIVLLGYTSDSFYPPWWKETLYRLISGLFEGAFAWAGWFSWRWIIRKRDGRRPVLNVG